MAPSVLLLSPHFPPRFHMFAMRLAAHGARVLAVTDQDAAGLHPDLRRALTAHARVGSLHDTDAVLAMAAELQRRYGPIRRVESHLETWLGLEAQVREVLGIPGPRPPDIERLTRKSRMKEIFRCAGVATARSARLADPAAVDALVGGAGFPLFAKPDRGVGAQGGAVIGSRAELDALRAGPAAAGYLLEEMLRGEIVSFDGLTGPQGELAFFTAHRNSHPVHDIAARGIDFWYVNERVIPADLERQGRAVVAAVGVAEKFFHIEFFRLPSGELRGLEINLRPPGGFTTDMFDFAHDIDVYDWWARLAVGEPGGFSYARPYHCMHISRRQRYRYRLTHEQALALLGPRLCLFEELNPLYATVMGEWAYLVRAPELAELLEAAAAVQQQES